MWVSFACIGLLFQSPSHRGSGAAGRTKPDDELPESCFNPLLIGEAAPPFFVALVVVGAGMFQSPSHRGSGAACNRLGVPAPDFSRFNPLLIGKAAPPQTVCGGPV